MIARLHIMCLGLGILSTVMGCAVTPPALPPPEVPPPAAAPRRCSPADRCIACAAAACRRSSASRPLSIYTRSLCCGGQQARHLSTLPI